MLISELVWLDQGWSSVSPEISVWFLNSRFKSIPDWVWFLTTQTCEVTPVNDLRFHDSLSDKSLM